MDRRGSRIAEAEPLKENRPLGSWYVIQVIEDRVEQAVRMHLFRTQVANDRSALAAIRAAKAWLTSSMAMYAIRIAVLLSSEDQGSVNAIADGDTPIGVLESEGWDRNS